MKILERVRNVGAEREEQKNLGENKIQQYYTYAGG